MFENYNIYDKMNLILETIENKINNKFLKNKLLNDDFFLYLFINHIKHISNNQPIQPNNIKCDTSINSSLNNDNKDIEVDNIQKKYYLVKKLYKKLSLIFHPDKGGDNNIFITIKRYYDYDLLIGLLSICYNNNIKIPKLSDEDERQILNEFILLFKRL